MAELPPKLLQKLEKRHLEESLRDLPGATDLVDFSSNDYLGLAQNAQIMDLALKLLQKHGEINGATGSRLLTGNHGLYSHLEKQLASFYEVPSALVFNSGYDANIGFFASVPQRDDIVFYDELIHASIRDGIQMGKSTSYKFTHNNLQHLEEKIFAIKKKASNEEQEIFVVTESVFSMDGDTPDLEKLVDFCDANGFHLVLDEAHAVGIFGDGRGMLHELGLQKRVFAQIITFGKAFGCHGAAVLGTPDLKRYLVNFSRSLIYTTALPPHSVATIIASLSMLKDSAEEAREGLFENIRHFKTERARLQLDEFFIPSDSAIHCAVISGNQRVRQISGQFREEGFNAKPILSPTVKKGAERLRFCLHAFNTKEEISQVLTLLKKFAVS